MRVTPLHVVAQDQGRTESENIYVGLHLHQLEDWHPQSVVPWTRAAHKLESGLLLKTAALSWPSRQPKNVFISKRETHQCVTADMALAMVLPDAGPYSDQE